MSTRIFHFDNEWDIHMSSESYEATGYKDGLDALIISHEITCFVSYDKWVERGNYPNNTCLP